MQNTSKTYSEKLKDPRWQKKRLHILERDAFRCQICLDTENTLHVHHGKYYGGVEPWDYVDTLLFTLCDKHHKKIHGNKIPTEFITLWIDVMSQFDKVRLDDLFDEFIRNVIYKLREKKCHSKGDIVA